MGKFRRTAGENNNRAKLTDGDIVRIRELYTSGKYSQIDIAEMFGVCQTHISRVVRRQIR
jgi:predicted XRE-type DNA-binding protein